MGSSVKQTPNTFLLDLIENLYRRVEELEANSLTQADAIVESLQVGEPTNKPGGFGDAALAANLIAEGHFNLGSPATPATAAGNAAISGNLSVEGAISGTGAVTGGDAHDHDGGDGAVIPEAGLAAAVSAQLVTNGDSHDHIGGDGAAIDTDALAAKAVTGAKIDDLAVDTGQLVAKAVTQAKIDDLAVDTGQLATNSVDDTKAGNRVPQFYRRRGGSSSNWSTQGTTAYTPGAVRQQGGVKRVTILDGNTEVSSSTSFGVSFGDAPIVVATAKAAGAAVTTSISSVTSSSFGFRAWRTGTSGDLDVDIHYIAVGPE